VTSAVGDRAIQSGCAGLAHEDAEQLGKLVAHFTAVDDEVEGTVLEQGQQQAADIDAQTAGNASPPPAQ